MSSDKTGHVGESFADVDWEQARKGPEPIEPGLYRAATTDATFETSKKGNGMIVHEFSLLYRHGAEEKKLNRSMRPDRVPLMKKTAFRVIGICDALGIAPPKSSFQDDGEDFAYAIKGAGANGFWVLIKAEPYTDQTTGEKKMGTSTDRYVPESQLKEVVAGLKGPAATPAATPVNGASADPTPTVTRSKGARRDATA